MSTSVSTSNLRLGGWGGNVQRDESLGELQVEDKAIPIRRSSRTIRARERLNLMIKSEEHVC